MKVPLKLQLGDPYALYLALLADVLDGCRSALDVGCGRHSPACDLASRPPVFVGVDSHPESIEEAARGCHTEARVLDIRTIDRVFGAGSFDAVVALDVIEHLDKADGVALLDAMEVVAGRRVAVFTPNGFLPQGEFDDNPGQIHRSGWTVTELASRGYRVTGVRGLKPLRGAFAAPRIRPEWLGVRVSAATQPLVTRHPRLAHQLFAVLDVG